MKLHETIINIRVDLQNAGLKKSGKNKFAGFEYYELSDFLPKLNELMKEKKVNDVFTIKDGIASLTLKLADELQSYEIPFVMFDVPMSNNGKQSMQPIQYLGALNTYYKRYLYLNAFGITDGEVIDAMNNADNETKPTQKQAETQPQYINEDQLKKINTMMSLKKCNRDQLKAHYKISSFKAFQVQWLPDFIKYLEEL